MSDRNRNKLPNNLPQLQNLVKRDPDSYKEEVRVWSGACKCQCSEYSKRYTCWALITKTNLIMDVTQFFFPEYLSLPHRFKTGGVFLCYLLVGWSWNTVSITTGHVSLAWMIDSLTPTSDQDRISPYRINTISNRQMMRLKKKINWEIISWSSTEFSKLASPELYCRQ